MNPQEQHSSPGVGINTRINFNKCGNKIRIFQYKCRQMSVFYLKESIREHLCLQQNSEFALNKKLKTLLSKYKTIS